MRGQYGSRIKSNKRITIKLSKIIAILILLILVFGILANISKNKTEASTADVYDVILFFGQSNMLGCSSASTENRHGTTEIDKRIFSEKTGIDLDIVENIVNRGKVNVGIQSGVAYEYLVDPDSYAKEWYGLNSWQTISGTNGFEWNDKHLKPIGMDNIYGECLKGVTSNATMRYVKQTDIPATNPDEYYDSSISGITNMVPEFCKTYYELTGRKVVAVVCAKGGVGIDSFSPADRNNNANGLFVIMQRKMWEAIGYVQKNENMQLGKTMFVSMQGENHGNFTAEEYETWYRKVIDQLKIDGCVENGVLCETGGMIWNGPKDNNTGGLASSCINMEILERMHNAQETLVGDKYPDTVIGSRFGYNSFVPMNEEEYSKCNTDVTKIPGSNKKWEYEQALRHASLRMDYDYGYSPESSNKTSQLVRNESMDIDNHYNVIHYTSASLCQIGREAATNLAATFQDGQINLGSSTGSYQIGDKASVAITYNKSGGAVWVSSADPSIASIDTSVIADSTQASLVNTTNALELSGNTIKINANKVGKTTIKVESMSNGVYKKASAEYTITVTKKSLNVPIVTNTSFIYDGTEKFPTITGYDSTTMIQGGTTKATDVNTYTITWDLKDTDNYKWSDDTISPKSATWTISDGNLSNITLTVNTQNYEYDGNVKKPGVTVKDGNTTLTNGIDYTVSYSNNTNAGTASVIITGKGSYVGTKEATFTIVKRELKVTAESKSKTYGENNPSLTYKYSGNINGQTPGFTGGLTTTATVTSEVGEYEITNKDLALADNGTFKASNYKMNFVSGILTITNKEERIGDLNGNNKIDIGDILLLQRHIAQRNDKNIANKHGDWKLDENSISKADLNKNNKIDIGDILIMQRYIAASKDSSIAKIYPTWLDI